MKYRIHFTIAGYEDSFIITGESFREIRDLARKEIERRGLSVYKNNIWSEEIS